MALVPFPNTTTYFASSRTATVRVLNDGVTVIDASSPTDWATYTLLAAEISLSPVAAVTLVNGDRVTLAELKAIISGVESSQVALALRGYDITTNAILFDADSANSDLAASNENQQYKGMRVVLKDLRLGQWLGPVLDYNPATAYVVGDRIFGNNTTYTCIGATTGNAPPNGLYWVLSSFSAGQRILYTRATVDYSFASLVDNNADLPLMPDYSGSTAYAIGDKVFATGSNYICILAHGTAWSGATAYVIGDHVLSGGIHYRCVLGHTNQVPPNATYWAVATTTPVTAPSYWQVWHSPKWTLRQYVAEIAYGTTKVSYVFVYTLVNAWGEEGPSSDPVSIDADYGQTVSLHGYIDLTETHYQNFYKGAAGYRIRYYGFVSDSQGLGEYRLIKETDELGTSYFAGAFGHWVINKPADWTDALSTTAYDLPPDNPIAIAGGPNGMIGMITADHFAPCEPYKGWAWPERYRKALPFAGVGLMDAAGGWLVTTKRRPYALSGPIPEQLHMEKLALEQAGVSQKAMCSLGEAGIAYASNDGIVVVQGLGATLATGTLFTRKEWRARYASLLDKMRLGYHDGKLVCLFPGTDQGEASDYQGFVIRFDEGAPMYARLSVNGSCLDVDALNDQLLVGNLERLHEFETGSWLPLTWQSKEFRLPGPVNFGALQLEYTGGPVGVDLHGDGTNRATLTFPYSPTRTKVMQRLPAGYKAAIYSAYIYRATISAWSSLTTYALNAVVTSAGEVYASLQAGNLNKNPVTQPTWWVLAGEQTVHQVQIASTPSELRQQ